jgi:wyosine [tRNA(Phe)-imidazoG37] synthetase (radical SAM superfamily)
MSEILKKYVCIKPFTYLDVHENQQWLCCPSWAPQGIRPAEDTNNNLLESWNSYLAKDIRKSVLDGSYKFCDSKVCPSLNQLINTGEAWYNFLTHEEFAKKFNIQTVEDVDSFTGLPTYILFGFDRSCNLKCPSCRVDVVKNDDVDSPAYLQKKNILETIENDFSKSLEFMMITGSGDPFYSNIFRDYLINFDESKYPNLQDIFLITNANLLNETMWNKLKCKKFIRGMEISIDAGTQETYEKVTRLKGRWDKLLENLRFISTIKSLHNLTLSMVVSELNYKEMKLFYAIMADIFQYSTFKVQINYRQMVHWGTSAYSVERVRELAIFDTDHPNHKDFIYELKKIHGLDMVTHNFHHLVK